MIICPLIGYMAQYEMIWESQTVGSFSIDVCAIMLVSNTTRIYYWYASRFSFALLLQSALMIIMQFLLLYLCIKVRNSEGYKRQYKRNPFLTQISGGRP